MIPQTPLGSENVNFCLASCQIRVICNEIAGICPFRDFVRNARASFRAAGSHQANDRSAILPSEAGLIPRS